MERDREAYIWVEEDRETGSLLLQAAPPSLPSLHQQPRPGCGGSSGETKNREGFVAGGAFEGWSRLGPTEKTTPRLVAGSTFRRAAAAAQPDYYS